MGAKWSIAAIAQAHFATYRNARTGKQSFVDYITFVGIPFSAATITAVVTAQGNFALVEVTRLLGGIGVFTGLLFGLLTNTFTLSLRVRRDEGLPPDHKMVKQVDELFANLAWSVVIGCLLVTAIVAAGATHSPADALEPPWTWMMVFLFLHLMLTVLMALKRLWFAHQDIASLPRKPD
ncbi:hypothetical protein [Streptomyces sp. SID11385]|uniref:hypothetical protein n=1 Tax=Streptomyces sp. SID11385 TaxID=2706031 RepID=UPI0013C9EFE3|nr:hypothetical protein [Streptomyces sp. SID11385]NEA42334.1 hypothetical protein [Streptomyces sp. SID11385]